jgi:hypothetical protein
MSEVNWNLIEVDIKRGKTHTTGGYFLWGKGALSGIAKITPIR